jgi:hypothetical protein
VLCDSIQGCPWPQPHSLFASFLLIFDSPRYNQILYNLTKTNENVRNDTKLSPLFQGAYLVLIWKFFGNFLDCGARRLFGRCQVIFWNFLRYILFHVVTSCAAASYDDALLHAIRLCAACQWVFWRYFEFLLCNFCLAVEHLFHKFK